MIMTSRERVEAALKHEIPDRVPWCEMLVDPFLSTQLMGWDGPKNQTFSLEDQQYTVEEAKLVSSYLNLDNITYILRAPIFADKHKGQDGRLFYGEGQIKSRDDLEMIHLPEVNDEYMAPLEAFINGKGDFSAWLITRMGIMPAMLCMGTTSFSYALYDDPGLIEEIFDRYLEWTLQVARRVSTMGFDVFVTTDDVAFGTNTFFSPKVFRQLCMPRLRQVRDNLSIPWMIHSDGNMFPFMDDLLTLDIVGFHPIERAAMDIREVKRRYGDRLCLMGNLDLNYLGMGTREEVEQEVRELIRDIASGGGYIISSGNSLAGYLKPENVLAMRDAIQKYSAYPIRIE